MSDQDNNQILSDEELNYFQVRSAVNRSSQSVFALLSPVELFQKADI